MGEILPDGAIVARTGNQRVIHSGTIIARFNDDVTLELFSSQKIRLRFIVDGGPSRFDANVVDGELLISLVNSDNPLGAIPELDIPCGSWFGKQLGLRLAIHATNTARVINYTIGLPDG